MKSLLALKSKDISIYEPFVKRTQTFTVIPLSYFFTKNSIISIMKINTIAVNDYIYSDSAGNFTSANAYLAIKRFGKAIPYDQGGPIRIIFQKDSKYFSNLDAWNWSLNAITVKSVSK